MDRKTKHRIFGIFVMIGLVIVLLPFFQGNDDVPPETTLVKAPPFPGQNAETAQLSDVSPAPMNSALPQADGVNASAPQAVDQVASTQPPLSTSVSPIATPEATSVAAPVEPVTPPANSSTTVSSAAVPAPSSSATSAAVPAPSSSATSVAPPKTEPAVGQLAENTAENATAASFKASDITPPPAVRAVSSKVSKKAKPIVAKHAPTAIVKVAKTHKVNDTGLIDKNGLIKLKSAAWVIQLGSFKNKFNAFQLVNRLREKGYRAFIQQVSTPTGDSTRVFVGPENKFANARSLAEQLENEIHLRGMVISYKPLAL